MSCPFLGRSQSGAPPREAGSILQAPTVGEVHIQKALPLAPVGEVHIQKALPLAPAGRISVLSSTPFSTAGFESVKLSPSPWQFWSYSRLPGQDTMVRVIRPLSSFSRRTRAVWVIPQVLFPFTSRRMSPHLEHHTPRDTHCSSHMLTHGYHFLL